MDNCILWSGATQRNGYGRRKVNGKTVLVHRHAYEVANGPIPAGLVVDHLCHVRPCINPDHLQLTTREDNARRHKHDCTCSVCLPVQQAECKRGHRTTERDTKGQCRECVRERSRNYMQRRRSAASSGAGPAS